MDGTQQPRGGTPAPKTAAKKSAKRAASAKQAKAPGAVQDPVRDELTRVKQELDRSNMLLRRLLRELDDRGPNSPNVPQIWESVRQAATTSDQLIQRLDRLRAQVDAQATIQLRTRIAPSGSA